jgi:hypothetical protein
MRDYGDMSQATPSVRYRWTSGQYRSVARLPDRSEVTLIARPAGYPLTESYNRMFVPGSLNLLYDFFRYLRFRVQYRGQWTIDILRGDLTHGGLAFAEDKLITTVPAMNRKTVRSQVEELTRRLTSDGLEGLP